jgi:hypothetical protein
MTSQTLIRLKLLAALVALGCGIGAIVTVYELYQATPAATTIPPASPTAAPAPASAPAPPPTSSAFPSPPPGAVVLAKEDRDLAVALARSRDGSLQASVVGQEGPASGLSVSLDGVPAKPCGAGCYRARAGTAATVRVEIRGANRPASAVSFSLPRSAASGAAIVRRADRTWRSLETLVVHDHLSSGPGTAIDTVWRFKAPHRMTYVIRNGPAAVAIGARRWDKLPGQKWQASEQDPITEPVPLWLSATDAHLLGSGTLRGHAVWQVSFFDPQLPAWFTIWVDKASGRTLELRMTAQAHFMHQVYGPFDSPLRIVPPV